MPGKTASSWTPALLTTIWTAPPASSRSQAAARASRVGHVEGDRFGAAAGGDDARDDRRRAGVEPGVGVGDDVGAVARQPFGDRLADAAAGAGDEGALAAAGLGARSLPAPGAASRTTARRPEASSRPVVRDAKRVEQARRVARLALGDDDAARRARRRAGRRAARQPRRTSRALARKPGDGAAPAAGAQQAAVQRPSPAPRTRSPRSPSGRCGCAGDGAGRGGWRRRTRSALASHAAMRSSRHIGPRCGISASMPAWSSVAGSCDRRRCRRRCRRWRPAARSRTACPRSSAALRPRSRGRELRAPCRERPAGLRPRRRGRAARNDQAVDPLAGGEAAPRGGIADAQQQPCRRRPSAARTRASTASCSATLDVVQHVEDDDRVAAGRRRVRMSPQTKSAPSPSASRARATSRAHQLDAGDAHAIGGGGPAGRPAAASRAACAAAASRLASRPWPQPMSSTRVPRRDQAVRRGDARNTGSQRSLPRAKCQAKRPARRYGALASLDQRRPRRDVPPRGSSASPPRAWRPRRAPAAGSVDQGDEIAAGRGRALEQRRQHGEHHRRAGRRCAPRCRRAAAGCRRRARPSAEARQHAAGSRRTVSKPRRVQLTSCRPRRCSTGASNGLRRPAGARKKRGATPVRSASRACAAPISRAIAARPEQREAVRVAIAVVLHAVAAARRSRGRAPGAARAPLAMQKKVARAPCASSRSSTAGVTSGSGPSSIVIAISRRAAAAAGRRVQLRPSQRERGQRPPPVSTRWLAPTAPSAQGQATGREHGNRRRRRARRRCLHVRRPGLARGGCADRRAARRRWSGHGAIFPCAPAAALRRGRAGGREHQAQQRARRDHDADRLQHRDPRAREQARTRPPSSGWRAAARRACRRRPRRARAGGRRTARSSSRSPPSAAGRRGAGCRAPRRRAASAASTTSVAAAIGSAPRRRRRALRRCSASSAHDGRRAERRLPLGFAQEARVDRVELGLDGDHARARDVGDRGADAVGVERRPRRPPAG